MKVVYTVTVPYNTVTEIIINKRMHLAKPRLNLYCRLEKCNKIEYNKRISCIFFNFIIKTHKGHKSKSQSITPNTHTEHNRERSRVFSLPVLTWKIKRNEIITSKQCVPLRR